MQDFVVVETVLAVLALSGIGLSLWSILSAKAQPSYSLVRIPIRER